MVLVKILTLFASIVACVYIIRYRERIARIFGTMGWAERYLGAGGTYTMWIFIGIGIVFMALVWLVGTPWG